MKFNDGIESVRTIKDGLGYKIVGMKDVFNAYIAILCNSSKPEIVLLDSEGRPYKATYPARVWNDDEIPHWGKVTKFVEYVEAEAFENVSVTLELEVWEKNGQPVALYLHSGDYFICRYIAR